MKAETQLLLALVNFIMCGAIAVIALCRLNAGDHHLLFRVRLEYSVWLGGAVASGLQPWWGEWPEWGSIGLAAAVLVSFACSARAWHGDRPPAAATDFGDLHLPTPERSMHD